MIAYIAPALRNWASRTDRALILRRGCSTPPADRRTVRPDRSIRPSLCSPSPASALLRLLPQIQQRNRPIRGCSPPDSSPHLLLSQVLRRLSASPPPTPAARDSTVLPLSIPSLLPFFPFSSYLMKFRVWKSVNSLFYFLENTHGVRRQRTFFSFDLAFVNWRKFLFICSYFVVKKLGPKAFPMRASSLSSPRQGFLGHQ